MLWPGQGPRSRRNAHIASCILAGMRPEDRNPVRTRRKSEEPEPTTRLCFCFHAIPEVNRKLPYVSERMLICRRMVQAENLRGRIFHEVDGGQFVRARGFRGAHQLEVRALRWP